MKHLTLNKNIALLSTSLNPYPQTKRWESLIFLFSLSQGKIKFLKKQPKKQKKTAALIVGQSQQDGTFLHPEQESNMAVAAELRDSQRWSWYSYHPI